MTLVQFLKKYKIDDIISFHKEDIKSDSKIIIGWKSADSLDLSREIVISKSKPSGKKVRITAANISEYQKYFLAVTQKTPQIYLESPDAKPVVKEVHDEFIRLLANFLLTKEKLAWNDVVFLEIVKI